jgi:hypothetical protein
MPQPTRLRAELVRVPPVLLPEPNGQGLLGWSSAFRLSCAPGMLKHELQRQAVAKLKSLPQRQAVKIQRLKLHG